jgi:hypothetical protein
MTNLVQYNMAQLPMAFAELEEEADLLQEELVGGIQASFPVISFRGKIWRINFKGVETPLLNPQTGDPVASINVVLLKGAKHLSKIYYSEAYTEGDDHPPVCFSNDGVRPDPQSSEPQSATCAGCPQNVWGSKITPQGTKTKACADAKRFAVAPASDPSQAMLLRVPPASLSNLGVYNEQLKANNARFYSVVTKIGFDISAAYPKLTFSFVSQITDNTLAQKVIAARNGPTVEQIMQEHGVEVSEAPPPPAIPSRPIAQATPVQAPPPSPVQQEQPAMASASDDLIAAALTVSPAAKEEATAKAAKGRKPAAKPAVTAPAAAPPPAAQQPVEMTSAKTDAAVSALLNFQ